MVSCRKLNWKQMGFQRKLTTDQVRHSEPSVWDILNTPAQWSSWIDLCTVFHQLVMRKSRRSWREGEEGSCIKRRGSSASFVTKVSTSGTSCRSTWYVTSNHSPARPVTKASTKQKHCRSTFWATSWERHRRKTPTSCCTVTSATRSSGCCGSSASIRLDTGLRRLH